MHFAYCKLAYFGVLYVRMAEKRSGHELQGTPKTPEGDREFVVSKALIKTASFLFPTTAWISNKGGIDDRKAGEAKKSPIATLGNAVKTAAEFVVPGSRIQPVMPMTAILDLARYLVASRLVKEAISADPTKAVIGLSVAAGAVLSPNIIHLASKNRTVREAGKTVGRDIAKGAVAALRYIPPR